jgi:hypothetical protein
MRTTTTSFAFALVTALAAIGCGYDDGADDDGGDDGVPTGYTTLVAGDWSMPAGQEGYYCVRATASEDLYIKSFRPLAPFGTHHTALAIDLQGGPDGGFPCGAADTGFKLLFGSGVGTTPYTLPDGVAFRLAAGEQVILNLHLYNTGDGMLTGRSGIEIERVAAADVQHEAEVIYALGFDLQVPPGDSVARQGCSVDGDSTVFGVFPHMHTLGTHMRASAMRGGVGEPHVFFDSPFSFEEQLNYPVTPFDVADGERIEYECSFSNPGSTTVEFGDSTDAEMCVLGMYRYPARGAVSLCIN